MVSRSSPSPCATAREIAIALGVSGVNTSSGRMKTAYQIAASGPQARSPACEAASSPKAGTSPTSVRPVSGEAAKNASTMISITMPPR